MSGANPPNRFIVHVVPDEKFIDMAYREFEAVAPGSNRFIITGKPRVLRHVKSLDVSFCTLAQAAQLFREARCAGIIFHSLGEPFALDRAPADKPIVWIGWGYDYYDRLLAGAQPDGLLLPSTRELWRGKPQVPAGPAWVARCKAAAGRALRRTVSWNPQLLSKIRYFSPVLDVEHELACRLNPWFRPEYVPWNYGTAEDDLGAGSTSAGPGRNLLVGNSATFENNHLELFSLLERHVDLAGRKIIVPLSYGDDWYRDQIIAAGRRRFGDALMPLTTFMPQDEYQDVLQTCGHVFMNHLRQQGLANICIMMLKGARVHMNAASPLYRWLVARGARVTSLGVLEEGGAASRKLDLAPLAQEDRQVNAEVIHRHWGREVQRERTRMLVNLLLADPPVSSR